MMDSGRQLILSPVGREHKKEAMHWAKLYYL